MMKTSFSPPSSSVCTPLSQQSSSDRDEDLSKNFSVALFQDSSKTSSPPTITSPPRTRQPRPNQSSDEERLNANSHSPRGNLHRFKCDGEAFSPIESHIEEEHDLVSEVSMACKRQMNGGSMESQKSLHVSNSRDSIVSSPSKKSFVRPLPVMVQSCPKPRRSLLSQPLPDMKGFDPCETKSPASPMHPTKSPCSTRPLPDLAGFDDIDRSQPTVSHYSSRIGPRATPKRRLAPPPTPCASRTPRLLLDHKTLATCPARVVHQRKLLETSILDGCSKEDYEIPTKCPGTPTSRKMDLSIESGLTEKPCTGKLDSRTPLLSPAGDLAVVSMATHFEDLGILGSGTFSDVYKVQSKKDGQLYAVKKRKTQLRSERDRYRALAEVRCMQSLQSDISGGSQHESFGTHTVNSLYLLFFFQAWQEDGFFYCQTELCCRETCRDLIDTLRLHWEQSGENYPSLIQYKDRLIPEPTLWKICHDVAAGLSHVHSCGFVHFDIKPANIFFILHDRFGVMCKIGDFGMSGEIGSSEDGQEGDQRYMAPELLVTAKKHPSADIFSFGLTLYELASSPSFVLPSEGARWHDLRSGTNQLDVLSNRDPDFSSLIISTILPSCDQRPTAQSILSISKVSAAGAKCDEFLRDFVFDVKTLDEKEELLSATKKFQSAIACTPTGDGRCLSPPFCLFTP